MNDFPDTLSITEEGPREGFQIEKSVIPTSHKVKLIDALSGTGLKAIQACSFVSPKLVPGWADADEVVRGITPVDGVEYHALWFNKRGIDRALAFRDKLHLYGTIHVVASEAFSISNLNRNREANLAAMRQQSLDHMAAGLAVGKVSVMAAFGCNFQGEVSVDQALGAVQDGFDIAAETGCSITEIALADTMGWANPKRIREVVVSVRKRWPQQVIRLHLHDTRGLGIANAFAAMECGVTHFDTTVGGLGGCPFAAHPGAPGNIATEELVLLAEETGVATGVDLDQLIAAGHFAEQIIGRRLPSAVLRGGRLPAVNESRQAK